MKTEILQAIRAAADAKAAYWDRMGELEKLLGCEDPPDRLSDFLVEYINGLAVSVDGPGDVDWIDSAAVSDVTKEVAKYDL